jgi:hypothetical protein
VIDFEVSLKNWLEDGKGNKEFKNKMEIILMAAPRIDDIKFFISPANARKLY